MSVTIYNVMFYVNEQGLYTFLNSDGSIPSFPYENSKNIVKTIELMNKEINQSFVATSENVVLVAVDSTINGLHLYYYSLLHKPVVKTNKYVSVQVDEQHKHLGVVKLCYKKLVYDMTHYLDAAMCLLGADKYNATLGEIRDVYYRVTGSILEKSNFRRKLINSGVAKKSSGNNYRILKNKELQPSLSITSFDLP